LTTVFTAQLAGKTVPAMMFPGYFRIKNRHENLARQSGVADKRHGAFLFSILRPAKATDIKY
jgi:hypothetical protein